jgi:hypothetical protein
VKHICKYLVGTQDHDITYEPASLVGFIDSNYAGCYNTQKSMSGYFFKFRHGAILWRSKLQDCTATSMTKAEYVAASDAAKEALSLG